MTQTAVAEKVLTGENQFTDPFTVVGDYNFSLVIPAAPGSFVGTVSLERKFAATDEWGLVATFAGAFEGVDYQPVAAIYRFGIYTGAYTSGEIKGRLDK